MPSAELVIPIGKQDHVAGPDSAPVTLVEYGDFECPHCGRAEPIVQGIRRRLGDQLRFVFRHFPLAEAHPHAQSAAEASESAGSQGKFWEMHDIIFRNQIALEREDLLEYAAEIGIDPKRVEQDLADGVYHRKVRDDFRGGIRSGVNGTPTFFINGIRFDGDWSNASEFLRALQDAGALHAGAR